MRDDVTTGFLAGAGDSLNFILIFVLGLMVAGSMGHWWFWAIVVPAGGLTWWGVARHRRRRWEREEEARRERLRTRRPPMPWIRW